MEDEIELENKVEIALNIVIDKIAEITDLYSITKEESLSKELKEKVNVLNKIKDNIYLGNINIINNVIEKNKKGLL